jgi:PPOX class probable F420-dependent enzyme
MSMTRSPGPFGRFTRQKTVALTTFRRDGTGVSTPVNIVVDGDHAYFRTPHVTGKAKRLRNNPDVELAPSTLRGTPTGPRMRARARLLSESETPRVRRALARKYPLLHGLLVPLVHRVRKYRTLHYELAGINAES